MRKYTCKPLSQEVGYQMNEKLIKPERALFIKELANAKSAAYWLNCIFLTGATVWVNVFALIESIQPLVSTAPEVADYMADISSQVYALIQPLWVFLLIWMFLSAEVFISEKTDGRLEMLLTTPLKLKGIWNSKRKALLILILPFTFFLNVLVFLLKNRFWPLKLGINPVVSPPTIVLAFLVAPLTGYCLGSFTSVVSFLVSNPMTVQSVNFVIVFALGFAGNYFVSSLIKETGTNLVSWRLVAFYTVTAIAIWAFTFFLSRKLDKDYVISHNS